jgi:hypothetical protein
MKRDPCMVISKEMAALMIPLHVRWIKEGRGTGEGANYLPLLQTEDTCGTGNRTIMGAVSHEGLMDCLSGIEAGLALTADWCEDVREVQTQYPLDINFTFRKAKEYGWKHPCNTKGQLAVMSSDARIIMKDGSVRIRTVKERRGLSNTGTARKLWIEYCYWVSKGVVDWKIVTPAEINPTRVKNIRAMRNYRDLAEYGISPAEVTQVRAYCQRHFSEHGCLSHCTTACDQALGLRPGDSLAVARHLIASRQWHWDFAVEFDPREPGQHRKLFASTSASSN